MNLHLRQTGRTTRMLAQAASYAAQGRAVYVYAHHPVFVNLLKKQFGDGFPSVKFETLPEDFNWETMRPENPQYCDRRYAFLVDHSAVEIHLTDIDKQIRRLQQLQRQLYALTT